MYDKWFIWHFFQSPRVSCYPGCSVEFIHAYACIPLLHQSPDGEPKAVGNGEVVLVDDARVDAGVRRGPLVGREPRHDPRGDGDEDVGEEDVEPDFEGEGVHEGK